MSNIMGNPREQFEQATAQFAAAVLQTYLKHNAEVLKVIGEMLAIMFSEDADDDERDAASLTFAEAMFGPHRYRTLAEAGMDRVQLGAEGSATVRRVMDPNDPAGKRRRLTPKSQLTEADLDRLAKLATPIEQWPEDDTTE